MPKLAMMTTAICAEKCSAGSPFEDASIEPFAFIDPVGSDTAADKPVIITDRQLARLMTVAAETGGRFEREKITVDPLTWLYSPRKIFDGRAPVEACRSQSYFVRAILLHGLSLGLDAAPEFLDELHCDEDEVCPVSVARAEGVLTTPVCAVG